MVLGRSGSAFCRVEGRRGVRPGTSVSDLPPGGPGGQCIGRTTVGKVEHAHLLEPTGSGGDSVTWGDKEWAQDM